MQSNTRSTINRKLTRLVTTAVATALLLALAAFVFSTLRITRQSLSDQMSVLADVLAANSAAAVTFDDQDSAQQVLDALSLEPSVESACIFTADGRPFASYLASLRKAPQIPAQAPSAGLYFDQDGHLSVATPIRTSGEVIGTLFLHATNDRAYRQLVKYSTLMSVVLLLLFLAAQRLAARLQRGISGPIVALAQAAERVSAEQDYSIRVAKVSDDEIGALVDEFNHMLEQVDAGKRELQAAHERLAKQSEERMRAIVETAADGIVTISADGTVESCNSASCELLKTAYDELVGSGFIRYFPKLGGVSWPEFVREQLRSGESRSRGARQYEAVRQDDTTIPLSVSLSEFSADGSADGTKAYTAILRDLTEFQRLQMELAQAQKLESIGQMSAGIAHEINTPMQFISDNISFMRDSFVQLNEVLDKYDELLQPTQPPASWEDRCRRVEETKQAAHFDFNRTQIGLAIAESQAGIDRIIEIVRAMKQFSHFGSGEKSVVSLNDAICSTATITRNRWKYVSNLELELDPNLPPLECYASEINQVLLNLVVNAADAIADKLGSDPEEKGRITIRTSSGVGHVQVEVEDTGCGIPDDVRHRIFDPFFTTKEVGHGTGQGLAITHDVVVNMHHGTIQVQSAPGAGAKFVIRLPLQADGERDTVGAGVLPTVAPLDSTATFHEDLIY